MSPLRLRKTVKTMRDLERYFVAITSMLSMLAIIPWSEMSQVERERFDDIKSATVGEYNYLIALGNKHRWNFLHPETTPKDTRKE